VELPAIVLADAVNGGKRKLFGCGAHTAIIALFGRICGKSSWRQSRA
jgi:hypothetical protein